MNFRGAILLCWVVFASPFWILGYAVASLAWSVFPQLRDLRPAVGRAPTAGLRSLLGVFCFDIF